MQQTSNYNLNLPEGTDIVNPLVDYNPNFTVIDGAMKANADRTVGRATCIKSGTTHVVTRSNTGSNIINFTATGDWNEGDTMTIDSVIVSVFLPDGSAALNGSYLINTEVFGILNGTRFTLYTNAVDIPEQSAANTSYDNTNSGLTATNVQDAIDEVASYENNLGTSVALGNITAYTPASEGYLFASDDDTGTGAFIIINDASENFIMAANNGYNVNIGNLVTAHVYKGRNYTISHRTGTLNCKFIPIVIS